MANEPLNSSVLDAGQPGVAALHDARVMVLLEDAANAALLCGCLSDLGYRNVSAAQEPVTARQMLLNDRPDMLILDGALAAESGLDFLAWVRADRTLQDLPVIMLVDDPAAANRLRALELGVMDYLSKPTDAHELSLRMRNTLAITLRRTRLAEQDALTGLSNRQRFNTILDWALTYARRMRVVGAVLQIGVDRFAQVNEALGTSVGDRVLQEVARRLMECVRDMDLVSTPDGQAQENYSVELSRIGSDEFSILLPVVQRGEQAATVAQRIHKALAVPFRVQGNELVITCCIGIAVFPDDSMNRDTLLANAGAAMAHAKALGRDQHSFYSKGMNQRSASRLALERDLRMALERNEFSLDYQAKVGVKAGVLSGAEALLRWRHPERGHIGPMEFIPMAEELDLMMPLGDWVLRAACGQVRAWSAAGLAVPRISVNVSARQVHQKGFELSVRRMLDEAKISGRHLVLEITESALMQDADKAVKLLRSLREIGVGIAIDDFGTGYSSLAYLRRFPLDELKIDKSFISEFNDDSKTIVSAIIALGHSLRLKVVAEGVEYDQQLQFLRLNNCDEYQGFLFSEPIPASEFEALMRRQMGMLQ